MNIMHRDTNPRDDCDLFATDPHVGRKDCRGDGHYMCRQCRRGIDTGKNFHPR